VAFNRVDLACVVVRSALVTVATSCSIASTRVVSEIALTAPQKAGQVWCLLSTSFQITTGIAFLVAAMSNSLSSGITPANLSTLSAHMICDNSSTPSTFSLCPNFFHSRTSCPKAACFSSSVLTVVTLSNQRNSNACCKFLNMLLSIVGRLLNHSCATDPAFRFSQNVLTLLVSFTAVFPMKDSSRPFMKSCRFLPLCSPSPQNVTCLNVLGMLLSSLVVSI